MASTVDEEEALHHKTLAESNFNSSKLKSALKHARKAHLLSPTLPGLSPMLAAFEILSAASASADYYKILQVEPFSHINTIKKQYKKLALLLHPDKNPSLGCEEAFKIVNEGFRVFNDRIRRKEYDMKLRIRMQEELRVNEGGDEPVTFSTACSMCRSLHKFERKYLGSSLVCPNCKKSFEAKEVVDVQSENGEGNVEGLSVANSGLKVYSRRKKASGGDGSGMRGGVYGEEGSVELGVHWSGGRSRSVGSRRRTGDVGGDLLKSKEKGVEGKEGLERLEKELGVEDEMMTLAQMQLEIKRKGDKEKVKLRINEKENDKGESRQEISVNKELINEKDKVLKESSNVKETQRRRASKKRRELTEVVDLENESRGDRKRNCSSKGRKATEIMMVEDSDFYDFGKDRTERSFRKGQVWATYDDADGMPRRYCLFNEVVSLNPFEVNISWLDFQNDGKQKLLSWEKIGVHVPCGRFKVANKIPIDQLNIFSHIVDCERAAREVYLIYPKKGSVWAVYSEKSSGFEMRNISHGDKKRRHYDIVVCLTAYSEMHGLSMAYLEKVDGFRTIFKRKEIGSHSIVWLEKDDVVHAFSHQIPARKLPEDHQVSECLKECWELDPASLPHNLLATNRRT